MRALGLCDWNPGGVAILTVYKHGSFAAAAANAAAEAAEAAAAAAVAAAAAASSSPSPSFSAPSAPPPPPPPPSAAAAAAPSARAALEGEKYAIPSLRWLGAHASWFLRAGTRDEALQPLTQRYLVAARSLAAGALSGPVGGLWLLELEAMAVAGAKAELEAVEDGSAGWTGLGSLSRFVAWAINAGLWI